jgi:Phosphodiester glycosidase
VGWRLDGREYVIGRLSMSWYLEARGRRYPVDGINRPRGVHEAILFNWAFHRSTLTDPGGVEVRVAGNRVVAVSAGGNSPIPPQGFVYSVGPTSDVSARSLARGTEVRAAYRLSAAAGSSSIDPERWRTMDFVIGGLGLLLRDGRILADHANEKMREGFGTELHPRTAVGFKRDGTWVLVVVDGRQPEISIGMSLDELARLMLALGCADALNLDGGGSSGRGRNRPRGRPPAQIRTGTASAYGSYLG